MTLALIAAMARNRAIGHQGRLPWRLPEDLRRFKAITMGHVLLMGRTTFDSIGRPLPGRRTIVVTRQANWSAPGVEVASSVDEALDKAGKPADPRGIAQAVPVDPRGSAQAVPVDSVFVAGGGDIFRQTIDRAARLYLTLIDRDMDGDTFFPEFDPALFRVIERERHHDEPLPFEFLTFQRK